MLPEPRRWLGRLQTCRTDPEGRPRIHRTIPGVRRERLPLAEMLERRDVRAVGDRCVGDPEGRRQVEHVLHGVLGDPGVDRRRQRRSIEEEGRILHPLGVPDHGAEVEPLLPRPAPETDQAVAGGADAGRGDEPAAAHRASELVVERHRVVREAHRQGFEHRHVDELAVRARTPARRQRPDRAEDAGDPLPDLAADEHRGAVRSPAARPTIAPDHACSVNSVAGLSRQGPSSPKGVMDVTVRCGWTRRISCGAKAVCSTTREPRDHTTASADASSACSNARSSARSHSTTTLCFDAFRKLKSAPSASAAITAPEADHRRSGSPSGASTLITSAPPSASSLVQ